MSEVLVTVLGMLAAFATAFLAEPVKIYFQNRSKLKKIRISLYKETFHNFEVFRIIPIRLNARVFSTGELIEYINTLNGNIRTEYYDQTLINDLESFYQLKESATFYSIYEGIQDFFEPITLLNRGGEDNYEIAKTIMIRRSNGFCENIKDNFFLGRLDKKLLKKIEFNSDYYKEISSHKTPVPYKLLNWIFWK